MAHDFADQFGFDPARLQSRKAYFRLEDSDLAALAALRPLMEEHTEGVVDAFYELWRMSI